MQLPELHFNPFKHWPQGQEAEGKLPKIQGSK